MFLEIGPGTGALTLPLAESRRADPRRGNRPRPRRAISRPRSPPNVTVLPGDVLQTDVLAFLSGPRAAAPARGPNRPAPARRFRVVGNLPYNISTPILFRLIDWHRRDGMFADATVMLQREVADRLVARPGTKDYGVLTVMLGLHAQVTRLLDLPPGAFRPPPKVRSRGRPTRRSAARGARGRRGPVRAHGEGDVQPAAKDAGQRAEVRSTRRRRPSWRWPASTPSRRPETLQLAEMAQLADLFASVRQGRVCYSFAVLSPVFGSLPATHQAGRIKL